MTENSKVEIMGLAPIQFVSYVFTCLIMGVILLFVILGITSVFPKPECLQPVVVTISPEFSSEQEAVTLCAIYPTSQPSSYGSGISW
jgi:hypothetical protein